MPTHQPRLALVRASQSSCKVIRPGQRVRIGRHADNDLVVSHKSISRFHAELVWDEGAATPVLKDLDSANGTKVNGRKLAAQQACIVPDGAAIELGTAPGLTLEYKGAGASELVEAKSGLILESVADLLGPDEPTRREPRPRFDAETERFDTLRLRDGLRDS